MSQEETQEGSELSAGLGRRIEARIPDVDLFTMHSDMQETLILGHLKNAGIPAKGTFFFAGLKSGTLHQFRGANHTVYVWTEP